MKEKGDTYMVYGRTFELIKSVTRFSEWTKTQQQQKPNSNMSIRAKAIPHKYVICMQCVTDVIISRNISQPTIIKCNIQISRVLD